MAPINQVPGPYEDTTCQMVAAYGNPSHRHLETIRLFRDEVLESFRAGSHFVSLYYRITPFFAELAKKSRTARILVLALTALPAYLVAETWAKLTGRDI